MVLAVVAAAVVITAVAGRSAPAVRAAVVVVVTVFVIFTGGAWLKVGPVVTAVAVSALPLRALGEQYSRLARHAGRTLLWIPTRSRFQRGRHALPVAAAETQAAARRQPGTPVAVGSPHLRRHARVKRSGRGVGWTVMYEVST